MLCHHPGKGLLGRTVLQGRSGLERRKPVCIVAGVFLLFSLQGISTELNLLVKYGIDFFVCDKTSLLTQTADWISPIGCSNINILLFYNRVFNTSCLAFLFQQIIIYEFPNQP